MSRRKIDKRNIRKLTRTGSSIGVTLPVEFLRELKWREKQKVIVEKKGRHLIIRDWKK